MSTATDRAERIEDSSLEALRENFHHIYQLAVETERADRAEYYLKALKENFQELRELVEANHREHIKSCGEQDLDFAQGYTSGFMSAIDTVLKRFPKDEHN